VRPEKGASKFQRKLTLRAKTKYPLWLIDTVQAKDIVYGALPVEEPGPRFQNFPSDLEQVDFDQLLSERPCDKAGRRGYEHYPKDARSEMLDGTVYADAALEISGPWDLEALVKLPQANAKKPKKEREMEPTPKKMPVPGVTALELEPTPVPVPSKVRPRPARPVRIRQKRNGW